MMDIIEAKRLQELERENRELKRILPGSVLKNRLREAIHAKVVSPEHLRGIAASPSQAACALGGRFAAIWFWRGPPIASGRSRRPSTACSRWRASRTFRRPSRALASGGSWRYCAARPDA